MALIIRVPVSSFRRSVRREREMGLECPCCRLVSPPSSMRCDCGFDFVAKQMDPAVFKVPFPASINAVMIVCSAFSTWIAVAYLLQGRGRALTTLTKFSTAYAITLWFLYFLSRAGKNWA